MKSIEGIILAAGLSSRIGKFKPLLKYQNTTLIEKVIAAMMTTVDRIYIVGGYKIDLLRDALKDIDNVEIVENADYNDGMFSSVCTGIRKIKADRFFLTPGDYPLVKPEIYESLALIDAPLVLPCHNGRTGHPVLIDSSFKRQILEMPEDKTLRDFIYNTPSEKIEVGTDAIFRDIDFMDDYINLIEGDA